MKPPWLVNVGRRPITEANAFSDRQPSEHRKKGYTRQFTETNQRVLELAHVERIPFRKSYVLRFCDLKEICLQCRTKDIFIYHLF